MDPTVSLRPAVASDWAAIAALIAASRLPLAGAQEHLPSFLVAVSNGEVVGTAGTEIYGDVALIRSVAVAPACIARAWAG